MPNLLDSILRAMYAKIVILTRLLLCLIASSGMILHGANCAAQTKLQNVILVLSDDHRHDFLSCHPQAPKWLETPALDRMAREGAHFMNAFVSTSLCSPSRASILTGQYMHHHRIVDNQRPEPPGTVFFPQYLQQAGFKTAFFGKWHMGHDDDHARPGFDHWVSYKGQGEYVNPELNINGERRRTSGYEADILTNMAIDWLKQDRPREQRFMLYLSLKAPHFPFQAAPRHQGRYAGKPISYPPTMARTEQNYRTQPRWVRERRNSIHGVDHMETGAFANDPVPNFDQLYRSYAEAVHSVDENMGKLLEYLRESKLADNTLLLYMGDNGFHLGEHGFYDKRDAFETSIRVPLLAWAPGAPELIRPGSKIEPLVQNIDLAPTILAAMGIAQPASAKYDGRSWLPLTQANPLAPPHWRDHILYEYHWEWNFPATPTTFAIRTERYKYVYYHGTWDIDSLHDLQLDPHEQHNLIDSPDQQARVAELRQQLFSEFEKSGAFQLPLRAPSGERLDQRKIPN